MGPCYDEAVKTTLRSLLAIATGLVLACSRDLRDPTTRQGKFPQPQDSAEEPAGCLVDLDSFVADFRIDKQEDWTAGIQAAAEAGSPWVNLRLQWALHEPEQGVFDWQALDVALAQAEALGVGVRGMIVTTPPWASSAEEQAQLDTGYWGRLIPERPEDLAEFATALVQRYRCRIPILEIYNEVNGAYFFGSSSEYVVLLNEAYQAIKRVEEGVIVEGPALATLFEVEDGRAPPEIHHGEVNDEGLGLTVDEWLDSFFAQDPQLDWFSYHPYGPNLGPTELAEQLKFVDHPNQAYFGLQGVETMLARLLAAGHAHTPLHVSEQGYLSYGSEGAVAVNVPTAAGLLMEEYAIARSWPEVRGLGWFVYDPDYDSPGSLATAKGEAALPLRAYELIQDQLKDYPVYEERLLGEPGGSGTWMEWFSGEEGDLFVVFNPTVSQAYGQAPSYHETRSVTLTVGDQAQVILRSIEDLAAGDLELVEEVLEPDWKGNVSFTSTPVPAFVVVQD